jgi:hypothetical protein
MPRQRKPAGDQRRGSSKLIKAIEKLAAALERNAAYKRDHLRKLGTGLSELSFSWEKPE